MQPNAVAAMPNKKLKRIKIEPGVGEMEEEEEDAAADEHAMQQQQQQQQQQPSSLRRKVDEDGHAVLEMRSQIMSLRAHSETQAAAIRGMEQARVMGEQVVELKAEIRIKDAALQANDAVLQATVQSKDAALQASAVALQSKDAVIEAKNALLQAKDTIILAKDAEIQRLQAELARSSAEAAVGGGARPAPAPVRAAAAAAVHAPAPAPAHALASAAIVVAAAAAAAAPPAPAALFPFSSRAEHKAPDVVISPDRLTVTRTTSSAWAWARSERGVVAGCGVVRWALQLGKDDGLRGFRVGVASDAFSGYTEVLLKRSWYFQDKNMIADGHMHGNLFDSSPFAAGDVVTVELERAPGVDGVLRMRVAGKKAREWRGLPSDGMLYPLVCLADNSQSYTMVALP